MFGLLLDATLIAIWLGLFITACYKLYASWRRQEQREQHQLKSEDIQRERKENKVGKYPR